MERSGYFPLCADMGTVEEQELAQVLRRKHALELHIEDTLQQLRVVIDPPLPPILQGEHVHGTSLRHRVGGILKMVAAWLLGSQADAGYPGGTDV